MDTLQAINQLEKAFHKQREALLQAHGVLTCLYEVLLHADGEAAASYAQAAHVARRLIDESDATVFTVGLGRGQSQKDLREKLGELADASGGLALFAGNPEDLAQPFAEIVETLSNQYTLSFEPRRDGKYHELTVQVPGRDVRVRARRGYVGPRP